MAGGYRARRTLSQGRPEQASTSIKFRATGAIALVRILAFPRLAITFCFFAPSPRP
jgi:hypothetical protein